MTKSDIVDTVFEDSEVKEYGMSRKEVAVVIVKFIEKLRESIENLNQNDRIELRGFGTFGIKKRKARIARQIQRQAKRSKCLKENPLSSKREGK